MYGWIFFKDARRQESIGNLKSGMPLRLMEGGCCDSSDKEVVRFSNSFKKEIEKWLDKGYELKEARVNLSCIGKNGRRRGGKSSFTGNSVGKGEKLKCFGIDDFINVEDDMKILETERLLLRGLEQGDFKDVCKLLQDDEVMYAYEGAFNDQEVQNWLDSSSDGTGTTASVLWGSG